MLLEIRTKNVCLPMHGKVEIRADPSAFLTNGSLDYPIDKFNVLYGQVIPSITILLGNIGSLYLSPGEVRSLLHTISDTVDVAQYPQNYTSGRTCRKALG